MTEVYVSIDIETDGPAPGLNSMLSLGAAAFQGGTLEFDTWYATMNPLPEAKPDPKTWAWWHTQPEALKEVQRNRVDPEEAMQKFVFWCENLPGKPVAVGWPIAFDFGFLNYYCHRFTGKNPLGFGGCDIRSYANGLTLHSSYYGLKERDVRKISGTINKEGLRPHVAVDDAIEQGRLFMALREFAVTSR